MPHPMSYDKDERLRTSERSKEYSQSGAIRTARQVSKLWHTPKATRKAKIARLLESADLAWLLSARNATKLPAPP